MASLMLYFQKELFNARVDYNHPWQIIRTNDGFLISHQPSDEIDLFRSIDRSNSIVTSSWTMTWIHDSFNDEYMAFVAKYLPQESECWRRGTFVRDDLIYEHNQLVLKQIRSFNTDIMNEPCRSEISGLDTLSGSDDVSVNLVPGKGFHRKFQITKSSNKDVGLLFILTRDIFVDSFDPNLLLLKQYGSFKIYGNVDLEAASYDDRANMHLLAIKLSSNVSGIQVDLPFHLRYQLPIPGGTYKTIGLPHPIILSNNENTDSLLPISLDMITSDVFGSFKVSIPDNESHNWNISVPIGDSNDLAWIPWSTMIVLMIGIYLVISALYSRTVAKPKKSVRFLSTKSVRNKKNQ